MLACARESFFAVTAFTFHDIPACLRAAESHAERIGVYLSQATKCVGERRGDHGPRTFSALVRRDSKSTSDTSRLRLLNRFGEVEYAEQIKQCKQIEQTKQKRAKTSRLRIVSKSEQNEQTAYREQIPAKRAD